MPSYLNLFKLPLKWVSVLPPFLLFSGFWLFGFSSIFLTSTVLVSATIFFSSFQSERKEATEEATTTTTTTTTTTNEAQIHDLLEFSHSSTSEDSEFEGPDCSDDGSISDEESLIEIALPSGHYMDSNDNEDLKFNVKFPTESIFKQHSLMEILAEINEMNEEENLIEIDISMGSIKCSRFEIEA